MTRIIRLRSGLNLPQLNAPLINHGSHASWKALGSSGIPPPLSRAWKVLEISVGSGKFWKFDVSVWEVVTDYSITFDFANLHYAL